MDEFLSKSQKKRDADALQALGIQLTTLSAAQLEAMALPQELLAALMEAKRLKSHGAMRRQAQFIGKLMRSVDHETILANYEALQAEKQSQTASFHEIEAWRNRLLTEGKQALTDFLTAYPQVDSQKLRQLIKKTQDEQQRHPEIAGKVLFRFLRSSIL